MAQENFIGNTTPPTFPDLIIEEPKSEQWNSTTKELERHCSKNTLLAYSRALESWFDKYNKVKMATTDGKIIETELTTLMTKTSSSKNTIAKGVAMILSNDNNLRTYIDNIKPEMKNLLKMLLFNIYLSQDTAKKILKIHGNLYTKENSYFYNETILWSKNEYGWFSLESLKASMVDKWGYRENEYYISLNPLLHSILFPILFPEAFDMEVGLNNLPDGQWHTVNLEEDSLTHFHLFNSLFQHGEFPLKKKGIGVSEMKKAQKKLALIEFFIGDNTEYRANLRAFTYIQMLTLCKVYLTKNSDLSYQDTMRKLMDQFSHLFYWLPPILYPHIKGLRQSYLDNGRHTKLCQTMITWLRQDPEHWVSIRDIFLKIYCMENGEINMRYTTLVFNPNDEQWNMQITNLYSGRLIAADSYAMEYGFTGLQMMGFILATLGIAEIAINEDINRGTTPFDMLDYIRLTPLGRYALGITDEYEAPKHDNKAYFELDPERLIIRSLVNPNPYAQLLKDTSISISKNRFETSPLSFLANCHTRDDVESKIKIFRQFISDELPTLWEQFFEQLLQHCHPLVEANTAFKQYTIDPNNHELIKLITTDPVMRKIIIRAEGYRILVKIEDLKKFETQLKKHGYLL